MGRGPGVRTASKTSLQVDFRYRGVRCREPIKLDPASPSSRRFAEQLKATIEREIALGIFDYAHHFPDSKRARALALNPGSILTWGELFAEWLKSIRLTVQEETYADYAEYIAKTWRPLLGSKAVSEPIWRTVNEWLSDKSASKKRILNLLTPLRQACRYAAGPAKLLKADPLKGLTVQRAEMLPLEDLIDPFTPQEIAAAVGELHPQNANLVHVWAWTGMREGELFALTWSDVDFEKKTIRISKSSRGGRLKGPKTAAGVRTVKLLPPALEALQRQREHTLLKRRQVFLRPGSDEPWGHDKAFRVVWKLACERAAVRYRFPRQLRHTFASWMLGAGENPLWVSKQLGHKNPAITLAVYARFIPDMWPDAGLRAVAAIAKAG